MLHGNAKLVLFFRYDLTAGDERASHARRNHNQNRQPSAESNFFGATIAPIYAPRIRLYGKTAGRYFEAHLRPCFR